MLCVVNLCSNFLVVSSALRASKALLQQFLHAVLRSPLGWLETTPLGRILNRFSADINTLDTQLGLDYAQYALEHLRYTHDFGRWSGG